MYMHSGDNIRASYLPHIAIFKVLKTRLNQGIMKAYWTKQMSTDRITQIGIPVGKDKRNTFNRFNQFLNGL